MYCICICLCILMFVHRYFFLISRIHVLYFSKIITCLSTTAFMTTLFYNDSFTLSLTILKHNFFNWQWTLLELFKNIYIRSFCLYDCRLDSEHLLLNCTDLNSQKEILTLELKRVFISWPFLLF